MNKRQAKRLWNITVALQGAPTGSFTMWHYVDRETGIPGCPIGHYAARQDLQRVFKIKQLDRTPSDWFFYALKPYVVRYTRARNVILDHRTHSHILDYFGISSSEHTELFSPMGCGEAQNPKAAIKYIKSFLKGKGYTAKDFQ